MNWRPWRNRNFSLIGTMQPFIKYQILNFQSATPGRRKKKTRHHAVRKYVLHSMSMCFFNVLHLLRVCLWWNFYYWLMSQTIFQAFYLDGISASFQLSLGIVFPFSGWCVLQSFDINFCDSLAECNVIFSPATSWKINYYAIWYSVFYLFFLRRGGKKVA